MEKALEIIAMVGKMKKSIEMTEEVRNYADVIEEENAVMKKKLNDCVNTHEKCIKKANNDVKFLKRKEKEWVIDKIRYQEEINNLKEYIQKHVEKTPPEELLTFSDKMSAKNQEIDNLTKKIESLQYKVIHFQYEIGHLKSQLTDKDKDIKNTEATLFLSQSQIQQFNFTISQNQLQYDLLSNRIGMLLEEIIALSLLRADFHAISQLNQNLQSKLDQLALEKVNSEKEESVLVPLEDVIFKMNTTTGIRAKPMVNLQLYKYSRPSFAEMLGISVAAPCTYYPPFKHWVHLMIRGIYDSKFYEHSLCNSSVNSSPTRFTDFVYSWLSTFSVDEGNRNVIELEWWRKDKADEIRFTFMLGLGSQKISNSWEIATFKEFLSEEMMLDELGFFLHCRYLILKSPQLGTISGKYSRIHMVNLDTVTNVQNLLMRTATHEDSAKVFMMLKEKANTNMVVPSIDIAVALRILLEFYKFEKKAKFEAVQQLFEVAPKEFEGKIGYFAFRNICKNLNSLMTEYSITKCYRDCWNTSNGHITAEIFYLIANESSVLYNMLKLRGDASYFDLLTLGKSKSSNSYVKKMSNVLEDFRNSYKDVELIKYGIESMGVEDIVEKFDRFTRLLLNPKSCLIEDYWIWDLEDLCQRFWGLIVNTQSTFIECNSHDTKLLAYKIRKEQINSPNETKKAAEVFLDVLTAMNIKSISKNIAARKIQHLWKIKASRNLNLIATVMKGVKKFKNLSSRNKIV